MELDRALGERLALGLVVLALFAVVLYVVKAFLAVVVFSVFLYYSVRPIHRTLARFGLPVRIRAALSLVLFGVPFVVLISYTAAIVAIEVQVFLSAYDIQDQLLLQLFGELDITGLDMEELRRILSQAGTRGSLAAALVSFTGAVSFVSSALIQLLILVVLTYYMLVDGPALKEWALTTFDGTGALRRYATAVDPELSLTLFGNIVNVFVTAIVAVATFYTYNFFAPAAVDVPFPALIGALAGLGSLIPVVGIKLVYLPVIALLTASAYLTGDASLFGYVVSLFVATAIFVDFIPDFVIRALVSGEATHTGMLMVAYIVGPVVFGPYGLFLAPIILILVVNAARILLPYALTGKPPDLRQAHLPEFAPAEEGPAVDPPQREARGSTGYPGESSARPSGGEGGEPERSGASDDR